MVAAWVVLTVMLAAAQVASATSVVAPAFLWAPKNYGIYIQGFKDLVTPRMRNNPSGQSDLIVFCSGGFKDLHPAKTEGELLSDLIAMLKKSGAKYTILYASQPSGLLESPSNLPLGRYLAEEQYGECLVKSTLLEGTFVGIVLLIILISGLMCMMGIDTPSKFEAPQES
ncbi:unnamed protein product [Miscanthus lutarioriparius]|uniref:V-type proton ATPase subunit S1/VOA1 transmembrane domain-containing protein n=1 Tax=Miscanthus lutarioriparius TaxID=422564 RepID=A0A811RFF1_9POAL|nr:unnamed protein product [Miscanthus lutarioriparius]